MEAVVTMSVDVKVVIAEGVDPFSRAQDPDWGGRLYGVMDQEEVLAHLAANCVNNGTVDATRLDGWADLEPGQVTMSIKDTYDFDSVTV